MSVGVLALQGSFHEHVAILKKLGVDAIEVRKPEQLEGLLGLIIPGGESTTMAKLAEQYNLIPALKHFRVSGKPVWGTCAGLIFLADNVVGQKKGGQELVGGLNCSVHRNFFGSQLNSFETDLAVPTLATSEGGSPSFRAVFIRAPAILETGPGVEVLADYTVVEALAEDAHEGAHKVIVAVKQGNLLGTAFHPELTSDSRWHSFFLKMLKGCGQSSDAVEPIPEKRQSTAENSTRQASQLKDLPVFQRTDHLCMEL